MVAGGAIGWRCYRLRCYRAVWWLWCNRGAVALVSAGRMPSGGLGVGVEAANLPGAVSVTDK